MQDNTNQPGAVPGVPATPPVEPMAQATPNPVAPTVAAPSVSAPTVAAPADVAPAVSADPQAPAWSSPSANTTGAPVADPTNTGGTTA